MAQAPVPTRTTFLESCPKPEAFEGIDVAVVARVLGQQTDVVASYYGDRATLPLIEVDGGFDDAVCAKAARKLMASRGYNRQAGADEEIVALAKEATEWCKEVAGKTVHPHFVDSTPGIADDGPIGSSSAKSDAWTRECVRGPERCC